MKPAQQLKHAFMLHGTHATTKASRSRCMDLIHIWNLLMLQLKHQEVVAWM